MAWQKPGARPMELIFYLILLFVIAPAILYGIAWFAKNFIGRRNGD